jgi:hypothetical protein
MAGPTPVPGSDEDQHEQCSFHTARSFSVRCIAHTKPAPEVNKNVPVAGDWSEATGARLDLGVTRIRLSHVAGLSEIESGLF